VNLIFPFMLVLLAVLYVVSAARAEELAARPRPDPRHTRIVGYGLAAILFLAALQLVALSSEVQP
jgi:threonine/homoserine/homoserine lactone efflux protein